MSFYLFICFVIFLRIGELILARRNEKWLLAHGAIEYGRNHYPFLVALHVLFLFLCLLNTGIGVPDYIILSCWCFICCYLFLKPG